MINIPMRTNGACKGTTAGRPLSPVHTPTTNRPRSTVKGTAPPTRTHREGGSMDVTASAPNSSGTMPGMARRGGRGGV